ncbi:MAG: homocysteine S-methyltransferase family protein [Candidatus Omnitrophota bacterium]
MKNFLERLREGTLICDGAMGTMLMKNGMPVGVCPEEWGNVNKDILLSIHKDYLSAGSQIIVSNTFGANRIKLSKFNLENKLEEINSLAIEIAKEAAAGKAYVFGDIGPTGEYLKPVGSIELNEMIDVFTQQVKILEKSGADAIILETMTDLEELKAGIAAVKENTDLPLIVTMTFQKTQNSGFRTTSGNTVKQLLDTALSAGCDVVGTNCTLAIDEMSEIVREMRQLSPNAFIIAQPNAGMPKLSEGEAVYDQTPEEFSKGVPALISAGANIIGGCCGTTPEFIKRINEIVIKITG